MGPKKGSKRPNQSKSAQADEDAPGHVNLAIPIGGITSGTNPFVGGSSSNHGQGSNVELITSLENMMKGFFENLPGVLKSNSGSHVSRTEPSKAPKLDTLPIE